MDAAASGALDRRLTALERRLDGAAEDASGAAASGRAAQQRLAALEWRLEQVACSSPSMLRIHSSCMINLQSKQFCGPYQVYSH